MSRPSLKFGTDSMILSQFTVIRPFRLIFFIIAERKI